MDGNKLKYADVTLLIEEDNFKKSNIFNRNYTLEYGLGSCLRDYVGFEKNYDIKAFFEHGIIFSSDVKASVRVHESLPNVVSSDYRKNVILSQKNNNGAYAIGPYIAYAKSLLSDEEIQYEKKRLGRNLLVFPAHSTNLLKANYNIESFCKTISDIGKDFDSIRVCLYWKDVKNGLNKIYEKYGFEVVTAGYMNDPLFLNRLRSIIEISDVTISNELGSFIGFCFYLKKPHYMFNDKVSYEPTSESKMTKLRAKEYDNIKENQAELDYLRNLLSQHNAEYDELMPLINKYFGLNNVKSKEELKNIFIECENNYSSLKFYLGFFKLAKIYLVSLIKKIIKL